MIMFHVHLPGRIQDVLIFEQSITKSIYRLVMFSNFVCKIPASSSWTPGPKYHLKMGKKHQERIPYIEISPSFGIAKNAVNQAHHLAIWNTPSNFAKKTLKSHHPKGKDLFPTIVFSSWLGWILGEREYTYDLFTYECIYIYIKIILSNIYVYLEPIWPLLLKVNPPKTRPFPIKTGVIWVLGI